MNTKVEYFITTWCTFMIHYITCLNGREQFSNKHVYDNDNNKDSGLVSNSQQCAYKYVRNWRVSAWGYTRKWAPPPFPYRERLSIFWSISDQTTQDSHPFARQINIEWYVTARSKVHQQQQIFVKAKMTPDQPRSEPANKEKEGIECITAWAAKGLSSACIF